MIVLVYSLLTTDSNNFIVEADYDIIAEIGSECDMQGIDNEAAIAEANDDAQQD